MRPKKRNGRDRPLDSQAGMHNRCMCAVMSAAVYDIYCGLEQCGAVLASSGKVGNTGTLVLCVNTP